MIINIIANTIIEPGMSGGNRIFIENSKRWQKKKVKIRVFTTDVGQKLCQINGLKKAEYIVWDLPFKAKKINPLAAFFLYLLGTIKGSIIILKFNLKEQIVYSSSDYWPDFVPALIAKLKNRPLKWIAGFYLFAPSPWKRDFPYKEKNIIIGGLYWISQLPIYWLVKKYADMVFVTSKPDVKKFITRKRGKNKIVVIRGGVDIKAIARIPESKNKKYEAVFIGRFHPQKGVLELIDIWKEVVKKRPKAKLAMIGDGSLMKEVKSRIKKLSLQKNIELFGFLDGIPKIKTFKSAKIVIHPAIYDSGGMAACEALACGLPGVSFDLEALKSYYPKGIIKTPCYNTDAFANNIIKLLEDKKLYKKTSNEALAWAKQWDWNEKAENLLRKIKLSFQQ